MNLLLSAASAAANVPDIRDIRGPINLPEPTPWLVYLAGGLAALLLLWAAFRLTRRWRARVSKQSAYQLAKARLEAAHASLDQKVEDSQPAPDAFAEQVSGAVRQYIEARFALPVTQRTSEEFLSELLTRADVSPLLASKRPELSHFLETCDLAKFAARSLQRETMRALSAAALRFIEAAEHAPAGANP